MNEDIIRAVERAKELLAISGVAKIVLCEDYWKLFTVIAYHYVSEDPDYELVELYSRDGIVLRVRRNSGDVEWRIYGLHECSCICGG